MPPARLRKQGPTLGAKYVGFIHFTHYVFPTPQPSALSKQALRALTADGSVVHGDRQRQEAKRRNITGCVYCNTQNEYTAYRLIVGHNSNTGSEAALNNNRDRDGSTHRWNTRAAGRRACARHSRPRARRGAYVPHPFPLFQEHLAGTSARDDIPDPRALSPRRRVTRSLPQKVALVPEPKPVRESRIHSPARPNEPVGDEGSYRRASAKRAAQPCRKASQTGSRESRDPHIPPS